MKLSQFKTDKIRKVIPVYYNQELLGEIEIYNPTKEQAVEIEVCIENNQINNDLKYRLLGDLTNLELDCEINEEFYKYYNGMFEDILIEIEEIITEIALNVAEKVYNLTKLPENKVEILNELTVNIIDKYEQTEEELKQIELENKKQKEKLEIQRQIEELNIKLEQYKG